MRLRALLNDKLTWAGGLIVWTLITLVGYASLGVFQSDYFAFGPSSRLLFINAPIDTWSKWTLLASFRVIGTIAEAAGADMIQPWITTSIQDADKRLLPYPMWKCKTVVQAFYLYHDANAVFSVFLALTQADMALIVMLSQIAVVQCWTLPRWLERKTYVPHREVLLLPDSASSGGATRIEIV